MEKNKDLTPIEILAKTARVTEDVIIHRSNTFGVINVPVALESIKQAMEQGFNAGQKYERYLVGTGNPNKAKEILKYSNFDEYLKQLEGGE